MIDFNIFNQSDHLQPFFEKTKFDSLHGWDFGWELLEPINLAKSEIDDEELSKRFSPGQKTLYFFWYLDAQVTSGGFLQFYANGYRKYLPTIIAGLQLISDNKMLELLEVADQKYLSIENLIAQQITEDCWNPSDELLEAFNNFDLQYYAIHNNTMDLIEKYARQHPAEFIKLV